MDELFAHHELLQPLQVSYLLLVYQKQELGYDLILQLLIPLYLGQLIGSE